MTSPEEWGAKNEKEQLGNLIKSIVEKHDPETSYKPILSNIYIQTQKSGPPLGKINGKTEKVKQAL